MSDAKGISRRDVVKAAGAAAACSLGLVPPALHAASGADGPAAPETPVPLPPLYAYGYDQEPYPLDPGPHLFLDWRYVLPGRTGYRTARGESIGTWAEGFLGKVTADEISARGEGSAHGIRLEAQPAARLGPVLPNDRPWEQSLCYPTLGFFDGRYRMWYEVIAPREHNGTDLLCYAESTDGVTWEKPELGLVDFAGSKRNNIVLDERVAGRAFHGVGVFRDPSAPPEERYKAVYNARGTAEEVARLKARQPGSVSPLGEAKNLLLCSAVSPDGLRWRPLPEPLMAQMSDTGTTMYYDEVLRRYVGYFRMSFMNRRVIGRSEGRAVTAPWPAPEVVMWTAPTDLPSNDHYTNGKSLYPGTRTAHLLFPSIYQRFTDCAAIRMAGSIDGKCWMDIPGGDVLQPGTEGSWDGGCVFAGSGLAEIAGDRVALPYSGYAVPHKFPRLERCGEIGLAVWPRRRLSALVADGEGEFTTQPLRLPGEALHLSFHARRDGFVKVEVAGQDGRTLEDCDPLWGDRHDARVAWKGNATLGRARGETATLRFRLRAAKLFSFEIR